jgi:hypothetical protein
MPVQPAVDTAKMTPCVAAVYVFVEYAMPAADVVPGATPALYATVVSVFQLPVVALERGSYGKMGDGVQEVGCAVKRIDDPCVGLIAALDQAALFADKAIARAHSHQLFKQDLFGLYVCGRDIVARPLFGDLQLGHFAKITCQATRRLANGVDHNL